MLIQAVGKGIFWFKFFSAVLVAYLSGLGGLGEPYRTSIIINPLEQTAEI